MSRAAGRRSRIGVDLLVLSQFSDTGIVTYTGELLPRLFRGLPECDWLLFSHPDVRLPFEPSNFANVRVVHSPWMRNPWLWKLAGVIVEPLLLRLDVLFLPVSRVPLLKTCKLAVFVHDVGFLTMPEYLDAGTLKPAQVSMRQSARSADLLLTNSHFTRKEFCEFYGTPLAKVEVTNLGYDEALFTAEPVPEERSAVVLARYGIRKPYVLYLGVIQRRKNLIKLMEAAALWKGTHPELNLVLAGKRGWNCDAVYEKAAQMPDTVHMPGRIETADLPILYKNAVCYVLPSVYEGFGMPVIESMACGTPNVLSDRASLPEVGGDAALYFNSDDPAQIASAILRVVEDPELAQTLAVAGLERSRTYTWGAVGAATVRAFRRLLER